MKVLVVGSGAREHALVWKLKQSPKVTKIFCAPGNPGTAKIAENVAIPVDRIADLVEFAIAQAIDLTVVGPELPLSLGIVDLFRAKNLKVFGPTQAAARLESSKSFAKEIMVAAGVPTARYEVFTTEAEATAWTKSHGVPVVLKADGLAAGKGVYVCKTNYELRIALKSLFQELKATRVVAESFLAGKEASFIVATNGTDIVPLAAAHDYKRIGDRDEGPNTGGMGSVCPTPNVNAGQVEWAIEHVMRPVLQEMERRSIPFSGFLYAGLMVSPEGEISVLEFNARLGDPETQSILYRLDGDLLDILSGLLSGTPVYPKWKPETSVCLVLAAPGYPQDVELGDEISGLEFAEAMPGATIFHAGTRSEGAKLVTSGGRVLSVSASGHDVEEARARAYRAADMIQFRGRQMRRDIGRL